MPTNLKIDGEFEITWIKKSGVEPKKI